MRSSLRFRVLLALALTLPTAVAACSAGPADPGDGDGWATANQRATASGVAKEGDPCLLSPHYRKDRCAPAFTCATVSAGAPSGTCVAPHSESEDCDPSFGNLGCASGLACASRPGSSSAGFCKGAGTGPCRTANAGADCAAGRVCREATPGSGSGACVSAGGEGTPCDSELVENECGLGFECVVPFAKSASGQGVCTNIHAGGIGADCNSITRSESAYNPPYFSPDPNKCATGYVCALDPALIGSAHNAHVLPSSSWRFRCTSAAVIGEPCVGIEGSDYTTPRNLSDFGHCALGVCYGGHGERAARGVCANPVSRDGRCGVYGVDDCGWSGNSPLSCLTGRCVAAAISPGDACIVGTAPGTSERRNNCGGGRDCVNGHCR